MLTLAIKSFNDRIKAMNQTNSKQLVLTAEEARNLHSDIFSLINNISELLMKQQTERPDPSSVNLDGGGF